MGNERAWRVGAVAAALLIAGGCTRPSGPGRRQPSVEPAPSGAEAGPPLTRDQIVGLIRDSGLTRVAGDVEKLVRNTIAVEARAVAEESLEVGVSKLGGLPDLPAGTEWPTWQGVPLAFIAQVRLADLTEHDVESALPGSGMLYFFYDARQQTWGLDPDDYGSWKVVYHDGETDSLTRTPPPEGLPEESEFRPCALTFSREVNVAPYDSADIAELHLTGDEQKAYCRLRDEVAARYRGYSKLLGHPDDIQGDMQVGCELASSGASPVRDALQVSAGATDWRPLLQIDSEDEAGMMWGDAGMIYYWIRDQDLQARNFEDVQMVLQCY